MNINFVKKDKIMPWVLAARPKTLTASLVPIIVGTALAKSLGATISFYLAVHALMAAICIQIGTNFINDALDFKKGADTSERIGPQRATQSGLLTMEQVFYAGFGFFALAVLFGIPLVLHSGIVLFIILALSIACGYLYTGGPKPLAYVGLGDLFVFLFYGLISTVAVCYIQTGTFEGKAVLAGTQIGLLATVLIAINNMRDHVQDEKANKLTLAVRCGVTFSRCEITFLIVMPYFISLFWIGNHGLFPALLPWVTYPLGLALIRNIWMNAPGPVYNQYLAKSALLHLAFGVFLAIGLLIET